jgi:putative ABC transport system permease protein
MNKTINIRDILLMSVDALRKNKLRALLSTLGIIIGISTLMLVLGIAHAAEGFISDQLASFGSDTIFIEVKIPDADYNSSGAGIASGIQIKTMKVSDVTGVLKIPNVKNSYGAAIGQEKAVYLQNSKKSMIYGTTPAYVQIDRSKVKEGRYFNESENGSLAKVAVLGSKIKEELFKDQDAIGKSIRIKNINFKIIGVMETRGAALFQNYDDYVYLPLKTTQKLILGYDHLPYFVAQVDNGALIDQTAEDVSRFLRREHGISGSDPKKDDFAITTSKESQESINVAFGAISMLFSGLAAISLIVGGVGIMNIMYVSVTERIREIGLRKALGAKKKAILLQFLLEALAVTLLGGIVGVLFGLFLSTIINAGAGLAGIALHLSVTVSDLITAVGVTAAFGLVFGLGPARKAANLQPIEALRAE